MNWKEEEVVDAEDKVSKVSTDLTLLTSQERRPGAPRGERSLQPRHEGRHDDPPPQPRRGAMEMLTRQAHKHRGPDAQVADDR